MLKLNHNQKETVPVNVVIDPSEVNVPESFGKVIALPAILSVVTASFAIVSAVAPVTSPVCVALGESFVIVKFGYVPLVLIPVPQSKPQFGQEQNL